MKLGPMKKATHSKQALHLQQIPNIGPAVEQDLKLLGITKPSQLIGQDGLELYRRLNEITGTVHDPCMADTFLAAVDFMGGGRPRSWWEFTARRKRILRQE